MARSKRNLLARLAVYSVLALLFLGGLAYSLRFKIVEWYLNGDRKAQEIVISEIARRAVPAIEKGIHMTVPQSIFSFLTGRRSEEQRERDALKDVRAFSEMCFRRHWLRFVDVHGLRSVGAFRTEGSDLAVEWRREGTVEVLASFRVAILKGQAGGLRVNAKCPFFAELDRYVAQRARKN
jgi:hypothetical protein